ncbi:MAG TPA: group 1 truncated hemoglobin [Polyangia bacterium]
MKRTSGMDLGLMAGLLAVSLLGGCSSDSKAPASGAGGGGAPGGPGGGAGGAGGSAGAGPLYVKYGAAIPQVVDDAVAGVTADCELAPYFAVVGTGGHDSVARLKSCLRLQFTALFGGPATYPGVNDEGDTCVSMTAIHTGLGIPADKFDRFVTDFGGVLKADGVADADIATIATAVMGLQSQIVSSTPVEKSSCTDASVGQ